LGDPFLAEELALDDRQLANLEAVGRLEAPSDIQVVGLLSVEAADRIALSHDCRTVHIHQPVVKHIREKRGTERDISFVLDNLGAAVERPLMIGRELGDYRRIRIVHAPVEEARWLLVCLKYVPADAAKTRREELWVSTGHPIPADIFRLRNKATAWHILG